jgi:general secretion pathway protein B
MSLILEALRKSEAERRLGRAPDVLAPMPAMHAPTPRRRRPAGIAGIAVSILALAFGGWWISGRSTSPVVLHALPSASQATAMRPTYVTAPAAPAVTPQVIAPPLPASSAPAVIPSAPTPVRDMATSPMPRMAVATHAVPASTPAKAHDASHAATASAEKTIASPRAFAASPPSPVVAPAAAPPSPPADEPALLSVSDLPASERNALPALKVTMHVYADEPAQRFMIVDGQRIGEGGRLGEGIVLVRIRRDGAEIDAHGRRLLLPNP